MAAASSDLPQPPQPKRKKKKKEPKDRNQRRTDSDGQQRGSARPGDGGDGGGGGGAAAAAAAGAGAGAGAGLMGAGAARSEGAGVADRQKSRRKQQTAEKMKLLHSRQGGAVSEDNMDLSQSLTKRLNEHTYDCMICFDTVRRTQPCWSCRNCFQSFHLPCVKKWAQSSVDKESTWRCPGCQTILLKIPRDYRCFCGKMKNPRWSPQQGIPSHTCGDPCMQALPCGHECNDPCHAGPCPPCPVSVERACFCGRQISKLRCSSKFVAAGCGAVCGRKLGCGKHACRSECHEGECKPCDHVEPQSCYCGDVVREGSCGAAIPDDDDGQASAEDQPRKAFSCSGVCGAELDCGLHTCTETCHRGGSSDHTCMLVPSRVSTCPCGKMLLAQLGSKRRLCTDPIATCESICGKLLPCDGERRTGHRCPKPCHTGPCAPCTERVQVPCRCGSSATKIACLELGEGGSAVQPVCDRVCETKKACGKHRCSQVCCPERGIVSAASHVCTLVCGKPLRCRKHNCDEPCHRGHCPPCLESAFEEVSCHCGAAVLYPPVACGTALPDCIERCVRPQPCDHPAAHSCHGDGTPCPPCPQLVNKMCVGGHAIVNNVRCHTREVLCGQVCNKLLECGHHRCPANCHSGPCKGKFPRLKPTDPALFKIATPASTTWDSDGSDGVADDWEESEIAEDVASMEMQAAAAAAAAGDGPASAGVAKLKSCGLKCNILRQCGHLCAATCHPGQDCPPIPCRTAIQARCKCGHRREMVECRYGDPKELGFGSFGKGVAKAGGSAAVGAGTQKLSTLMHAAVQATMARVPPRVLPCNKRCEDRKREAVRSHTSSSNSARSVRNCACLCA